MQLGDWDEPGDQPPRVGQKQMGALSAIFLFFCLKLPPRLASPAKGLVDKEATLLQT
jgi:hypothetical protein